MACAELLQVDSDLVYKLPSTLTAEVASQVDHCPEGSALAKHYKPPLQFQHMAWHVMVDVRECENVYVLGLPMTI